MEEFVATLTAIYGVLNMPITLYGFTFSFAQIMIWSMIAAIAIWAVTEVMKT